MREVTDNALERLYWACRRGSGFPGHIPDESNGIVTTTDILNGLGLIDSETHWFDSEEEIEQPLYASIGTDQIKPPIENGEFDDNQAAMSSPSTFLSSQQLVEAHTPTTSSQRSTSELAISPKDIDMQEQFLAYVPDPKSLRPNSRKKSSNEGKQQPLVPAENTVGPLHVDFDEFLNTSLCTPASTDSQPSYNKCQSMPFKVAPVITPQFSRVHQSRPGSVLNSFLSPWPGSLAAVYQ